MKKLGGILVLLLGLAAVAFTARSALVGASGSSASEPKRQLDNVRAKASDLEREMQKQADAVAKRAAE